MIGTQYHGTIVLFVISRWEMPDSSHVSLPHFAPYGKCLVLRWKNTAVFSSYHFLKKVEPFCRKGRRQTSKRFYPVAAVSVPFSGRVGCKDFCCSVLLFRRMPVCFFVPVPIYNKVYGCLALSFGYSVSGHSILFFIFACENNEYKGKL